MLHFLIIAIQKTGSVSYMCIPLLFSPLCGFNYANQPPDDIPLSMW